MFCGVLYYCDYCVVGLSGVVLLLLIVLWVFYL